MKRPAKVVNVADRAARESSTVKEVLAPLVGMGVTMSRMVENITGKVNPTIRYPEERRS